MQPLNDETFRFDFGGIRGEIAAVGAMLGPVDFDLPDGRSVQPFAVADWASDPPEALAAAPPLLRRLRGEWPCVPFGSPATRLDLPPEWLVGIDPAAPVADAWFHGYGSNHAWRLVDRDARQVTVAIDYPDAHPVRGLVRRVEAGGPGRLDLTLTIDMRRAAVLPIALHPTFALPPDAGMATLEFEGLRRAATFPAAVDPHAPVLVPGQMQTALTHFRTIGGDVLDVSSLPPARQAEELLQCDVDVGCARLTNHAARYRVELRWDHALFPHCLVWISNHGLSDYPWRKRFRGVGLEPVASAFDLGEHHSANPHSPLARDFRRTGAPRLEAGPSTTRYSIAVNAA